MNNEQTDLPDVDEIAELDIKQPYIITNEDLSKKKTKQYLLIGNENSGNKYLLKDKWYVFKFDQAIYCENLTFYSNNKNINGLQAEAFNELKESVKIKISNKKHPNIILNINSVITGFRIRAPKRFLDKISLRSIKITGYLSSDFEEIENEIETYLSINDKLEAAFKKYINKKEEFEELLAEKLSLVDELEEEKEELESQITDQEEELKKLVDKAASIESVILASKGNLEEINSKMEISTNNVEQLKESSLILNKRLASTEKELENLVNNKNLFAYEVEDYIKQGNKNIQSYTLLSFLPWCLITYVTWHLFNRAIDLSKTLLGNPAIDPIDVIITRIPFMLVAGAIIIVSYEISKIFVGKIIEINTQKLRFSEIGIITKDVSYTSGIDLDLEENEKYELRTKLKMDLLRHHLKKLDPEKYDYVIDPSIINKYKSYLKGSKQTKPKQAVEDGEE